MNGPSRQHHACFFGHSTLLLTSPERGPEGEDPFTDDLLYVTTGGWLRISTRAHEYGTAEVEVVVADTDPGSTRRRGRTWA